MKDYRKRAGALRRQVDSLKGFIRRPRRSPVDINHQKAEKLWQEHAKLLRKVYPKPESSHQVQVQLIDMSHNGAVALTTSYPDLAAYLLAMRDLDWHYYLESEQVATCSSCSGYFYKADRSIYQGLLASGVCTPECLADDQAKQAQQAQDLEDLRGWCPVIDQEMFITLNATDYQDWYYGKDKNQ